MLLYTFWKDEGCSMISLNDFTYVREGWIEWHSTNGILFDSFFTDVSRALTEVLYFIILFEPVLKSGHLSELFLARSFL